ncbi:MAG: acetaldehyde dehydrogenase (acetylating) [Marinovum algicola]|jgi:acetaldehyde dehydrogenase|uniref:acetaldehyde dehydrogenase (acetylating) n=1 Tax=Marinovum algicola TaxID=42444 RepID=UPI0032EFE2F7
MTAKVAIIGSGNIGTDLMVKILRRQGPLKMAAMVGIDPDSEGLQRAAKASVATTHEGLDGLRALPGFDEIALVFDATSAAAHERHSAALLADGKIVVDLTPAAIGPYVVPPVNLGAQAGNRNVNMVTCGGQATIPIVAAVSQVAPVAYAEIVASIASRSAGPGTRANIDEFTETTARAIEQIGGVQLGKAIIVLNPAEPPLIMRDTVFCLVETNDTDAIRASIERMVTAVQDYVPGYRLKQDVQFDRIGPNDPVRLPGGKAVTGTKVTVFLEVEGAGDFLPKYAGNLDVMTSAALRCAEQMIELNAGGR